MAEKPSRKNIKERNSMASKKGFGAYRSVEEALNTKAGYEKVIEKIASGEMLGQNVAAALPPTLRNVAFGLRDSYRDKVRIKPTTPQPNAIPLTGKELAAFCTEELNFFTPEGAKEEGAPKRAMFKVTLGGQTFPLTVGPA